MREIIYYVAASLDGYIAGPGNDASLFVPEGNGVDRYLEDLKDFDTVLMGRKTYEFGYQYGLKPGQPAYPHMEHYIFSSTLQLDNPHEKLHIEPPTLKRVDALKQQSGTPIYLCGGGQLAGWLYEAGRIDILKLKLNPIVLGGGVPLFGDSKKTGRMELTSVESYDHGLQFLTYHIVQ